MTVTQEQADWFAGAFTQLVANVDKAILGKEHSIRLVITAMLSNNVVLPPPCGPINAMARGPAFMRLAFSLCA